MRRRGLSGFLVGAALLSSLFSLLSSSGRFLLSFFLGGSHPFYTIPPSDAERTPLMGRVPWAVPPRYCSLVVRCLSSLWMEAVGGARMLVSLFSLPSDFSPCFALLTSHFASGPRPHFQLN